MIENFEELYNLLYKYYKRTDGKAFEAGRYFLCDKQSYFHHFVEYQTIL